MAATFHVQQRDGRHWRTVTSRSTYAAATDFADELRHGLDALPHLPAPPVRVLTTDAIVEQDRISRKAAEILRRRPPWSVNRP
jgi:hypothetical protein